MVARTGFEPSVARLKAWSLDRLDQRAKVIRLSSAFVRLAQYYSLIYIAKWVTVLYPAHLTFYSGVGAGCVRPQKREPLLTVMFSGL